MLYTSSIDFIISRASITHSLGMGEGASHNQVQYSMWMGELDKTFPEFAKNG